MACDGDQPTTPETPSGLPAPLTPLTGNAVGRVVTATASVRNRTVVSISDYCAASGSTPQRILMTLCTIFSMLSISAAVFCEDRLKMWSGRGARADGEIQRTRRIFSSLPFPHCCLIVPCLPDRTPQVFVVEIVSHFLRYILLYIYYIIYTHYCRDYFKVFVV